jgi:RING-H2 zinc finger domain/SWIM zinc finger
MFLIQKGDVEMEEIIPAATGGGVPLLQCPKCTFSVLGSTGNCYDVQIQRLPHCSCPDHAKGNLCKHILFVLLKVMQIPPDSPLIYQSAWLSTELQDMFATMERRFSNVVRGNAVTVMANEKVQKAYQKLRKGEEVTENDDDIDKALSKRRPVCDDEICPICYDPLLEESSSSSSNNNKISIDFCRAQCGANFHKQCIQAWLSQRRPTSHPTCPMCRQPWDDGKQIVGDEGYANFGKLQGQAKQRDTSSYHSSPSAKRRRYY